MGTATKSKTDFLSKLNPSNLKGDKVIWIVILLFAMISIAVVYSSTSALAYRSNSTPFRFMFMQLFFYIIGFGILLLCYKIPLGWYRKFSYLLLGISIVLLAIPMAKGSLRTFDIAGVSIQPSEFAKISIILYLARVLETTRFDKFKTYLLKIMLPVGIVCVLCLWGSISVTIIICFITLVILISAGINWKYILYTLLIAIALLGLLIGIHAATGAFKRFDTFIPRIERFLNHDEESLTEAEIKDREEKNFQTEQAREAIQLGKLFGRGPGNSIKREILPNAYDDYIYSIIVEEYGLLVGGLVIMLYIWFFHRCIVISRLCKREFSAISVLGLALLITIQAFLHIFVNIGIFPVTGQTLPMISRGGSSLVIMSSAFGIILSVNRTIVIAESKRREQEEIEKEKLKNIEHT